MEVDQKACAQLAADVTRVAMESGAFADVKDCELDAAFIAYADQAFAQFLATAGTILEDKVTGDLQPAGPLDLPVAQGTAKGATVRARSVNLAELFDGARAVAASRAA